MVKWALVRAHRRGYTRGTGGVSAICSPRGDAGEQMACLPGEGRANAGGQVAVSARGGMGGGTGEQVAVSAVCGRPGAAISRANGQVQRCAVGLPTGHQGVCIIARTQQQVFSTLRSHKTPGQAGVTWFGVSGGAHHRLAPGRANTA